MMLLGRPNLSYVFKQCNCLLCYSSGEGLVLYPLGELVDGDVNILESTQSMLKGANHVQSPACKGPGGWDHLQGLCWDVDLLGEELTSFTPLDQCLCVCNGGGLVETCSESLADQILRGCMVAA
jgi:hypothetical protein